MTLAARLPQPNACLEFGVPFGSWAMGVTCCPNCRHQLRVSFAPCPCKCTPLHTPLTPSFSIQSNFLQQSPLYTTTELSPIKEEKRRLDDTLKALRLSGWYYGCMDWQTARNVLNEASIGAFLLRNSGDKNFIFALSIQTEKGPTSVRLHYENGFFRLDCERPLAMVMPRFRCAVELVQYYTRQGNKNTNSADTVWVDREGCPHSRVLMKTPRRKSPPTLLHAARLAVHKALDSNPHTPKLWCAPKHRLLPLPTTLIDYLGEYPYSI